MLDPAWKPPTGPAAGIWHRNPAGPGCQILLQTDLLKGRHFGSPLLCLFHVALSESGLKTRTLWPTKGPPMARAPRLFVSILSYRVYRVVSCRVVSVVSRRVAVASEEVQTQTKITFFFARVRPRSSPEVRLCDPKTSLSFDFATPRSS